MAYIVNRRAKELTDEFKEKYRWRSGIEATMSEYNKKTGVKQLRVRGFASVRFCVFSKAIGINLFRATAVRKAINALQGAPVQGKSILDGVILVFKELYGKTGRLLEQSCASSEHYNVYELKNVA